MPHASRQHQHQLQLLLLAVLAAACCLWLPAEAGKSANANANVKAKAVGEIRQSYLFLGCYIDAKQRDMQTTVRTRYLTTQRCYQQCSQMGYRYFGVQAGSQCHCGNKFGVYGEVDERECHVRCAGNRGQYCGGRWRNGIYKIDKPAACIDEIIDHRVYAYVGCYGDTKHRDLSKLADWRHMTIRKCFLQCRQMGYRFFGLQNGTHCFCGNRFGMYGRRPEQECNRRCRGNKSQFCGGKRHNAIYRIRPPLCRDAPSAKQ